MKPTSDSKEIINDNVLSLSKSFTEEITQKNQISSKISIINHRPEIFENIKKYFNITEKALLKSMNLNSNKSNIFSIGEGEGKSGSFFFYSFDQKFIIKTISSDNLNFFLKFVKKYSAHLTDNYGSVLAIIVGLYTLKIVGLAPIHIILMKNALPRMKSYVNIYIYVYNKFRK